MTHGWQTDRDTSWTFALVLVSEWGLEFGSSRLSMYVSVGGGHSLCQILLGQGFFYVWVVLPLVLSSV